MDSNLSKYLAGNTSYRLKQTIVGDTNPANYLSEKTDYFQTRSQNQTLENIENSESVIVTPSMPLPAEPKNTGITAKAKGIVSEIRQRMPLSKREKIILFGLGSVILILIILLIVKSFN